MRRAWRIAVCASMLLAAASFVWSARLYSDIQQSRRDVCLEGNVRHDDVVATYDKLIRALPSGPRRRRAQRSRARTLVLLEALAPKRDCENLVRPRG